MNKVYTPEGMPTLRSYEKEMNGIWKRLQSVRFMNYDKPKAYNKTAQQIAFPVGTIVFHGRGLGSLGLAKVVSHTPAGNAKLDNGDVLKVVRTSWGEHSGIDIHGATHKAHSYACRRYYIAIPTENA